MSTRRDFRAIGRAAMKAGPDASRLSASPRLIGGLLLLISP
jgi:hypothetical protein